MSGINIGTDYEEKSPKKWIIFDIDGTLFNHGHRIHLVQGKHRYFDHYHGLHTKDTPNEKVHKDFKKYANSEEYNIAVMTGRSEDHRSTTIDQLSEYGVVPDLLLMREVDDKRPGPIVKREWVDKHLGGIHNVEAVYEDAEKIVKMWVDSGVPYVFALPDLTSEKPTAALYENSKLIADFEAPPEK